VLAYAQTRAGIVEFGYRSASSDDRDAPAKNTHYANQDDDDDTRGRSWWRPPLGAGLRGGL
jgi:hypothetical protein